MGKRTGLQLIKIDFDPLENHNPESAEIQIFIDEENNTAHNQINTYLEKQSIKPYLGWNREVYPKYKVKDVKIMSR